MGGEEQNFLTDVLNILYFLKKNLINLRKIQKLRVNRNRNHFTYIRIVNVHSLTDVCCVSDPRALGDKELGRSLHGGS